MRKCRFCSVSRDAKHEVGCPVNTKTKLGRNLAIKRFQNGKEASGLDISSGSPYKRFKKDFSYRLGYNLMYNEHVVISKSTARFMD